MKARPQIDQPVFLTTAKLAERWNINQGTIENWRTAGKGPKYVKLGQGRFATVLYRLTDIEEYERQRTVNPSMEPR